MPWNGAGTFNLDPSYSPEVNGTIIDATRYNGLTTDIANGITAALAKNGENAATNDIPMGSHKFTGLSAGTGAGDSVRLEQAQVVGTQSQASAATCSIFTAFEQVVSITGTTTITGFGTNTAGQIRFCRAVAGFTITYNAASMVVPGAADLVLAAGDWFTVKGMGSSNAEVVQVTRAAGLTTALSDLAPATADRSLANAQYQQTWSWAWASAGTKVGFTLSGSASAPGFLTILKITPGGPLVTSLHITSATYSGDLFKVAGDGTITIGENTTQTSAGDATNINIKAPSANTGAAGAGGSITIQAGNSGSSGNSGVVSITGGAGATNNGYAQLINQGATNYVRVDKDNITLRGLVKLVLDGKHTYVENSAGAPAISSGGGTGATIAGADFAFEITVGTGSPTSVVVNFANTWPSTPQIALAQCSQAGANLYITALSTTQITIDANGTALSSGVKIRVIVMGLQ